MKKEGYVKQTNKYNSEPVKKGYYKLSWNPEVRKVLLGLKKDLINQAVKN